MGRVEPAEEHDVSTFSLEAESVVVVGKDDGAVPFQGGVLPGLDVLGDDNRLGGVYRVNLFRSQPAGGGEPEIGVTLYAGVEGYEHHGLFANACSSAQMTSPVE